MSVRDPIFDRPRPILFAHRGGAGEAPESTREAFLHAVGVCADVLEIDLQVTSDGVIVVWHGPGLKNVYNSSGRLSKQKKYWFFSKKIGDHPWPALEGKAWVEFPYNRWQKPPVSHQPRKRLLMTFEEFVQALPEFDAAKRCKGPVHLNVELKETMGGAPRWKGDNSRSSLIWEQLFGLLETARRPVPDSTVTPPQSTASPTSGQAREILVTSFDLEILQRFRNDPQRTNLPIHSGISIEEQYRPIRKHGKRWPLLKAYLRHLIGGPRAALNDAGFQTWWGFVTRDLVEHVHEEQGALHAVISRLSWVPGLRGLDRKKNAKLGAELAALKAMGVDGVMTDYPKKLRSQFWPCSCATPPSGTSASDPVL
ncbi:MAG: glycerophosphodiester phosphodiesterase family protein [Planctomycetota bacterium]|nr:glycerophosphodiester phosphodiesterase family protein [Planctomycetota bacterium]